MATNKLKLGKIQAQLHSSMVEVKKWRSGMTVCLEKCMQVLPILSWVGVRIVGHRLLVVSMNCVVLLPLGGQGGRDRHSLMHSFHAFLCFRLVSLSLDGL